MWTPKDPSSSEFFGFDFGLLLTEGDTVLSVVGVTVTGADNLLTHGAPATNGNLVVVRLTGGTLGLTYAVKAEVTTVGGETLDLTAYLVIRPQM
jgi:hypothetical protein